MPGRTRARRALGWTALVLGVVVVLPVTGAATALRVSYAGDPHADARTRGRDALWLGHAWVDGRRGEDDLKALKRRLAGTGIRDLYVHAGPLEHDGSLPAKRYPHAKWLLGAVERELPGVRVQAWLGDRLVYGDEERGGLRLADGAARRAVVKSARQVLDAGFDGVHFDLEPLHSDDSDYLRLLDRLRPAVRARGGLLSVAAHQIDPLPGLHHVSGTVAGHGKWWSQEYFGKVARRVDQIAVMSYDTALPAKSLYGGYVAQQTVLALEAAPARVDVLMGLPFYHTDDMGHHASAETVAAAVRGVRLGLGREDRRRSRFGVALYVDFAATERDWRDYRNGWGARGGGAQ
nr:glycosyl hydrolase family 18 protein [Streptomyces oryzae]